MTPQSRTLLTLLLALAACMALLVAPSLASAAPISWVGAVGGGDGTSWSDGNNWSGGGVPASGDDVTIAGASVNVDVNAEAHSISVTGASTITQQLGTQLMLDYDGPKGPGVLTIGSAALWHQLGTFGADVDIEGSGVFQIDNAAPTIPMDFYVGAGMTVRQLQDVTVDDGIAAYIQGTWDMNGHNLAATGTFGGNVEVDATGRIVNPTGSATMSVPLVDDYGSLEAGSGATLVTTKDIRFGSGASLDTNGAGSAVRLASGAWVVNANIVGTGTGTIEVRGALPMNGRTFVLDGAPSRTVLNVTGSGSLTGGASLIGGTVQLGGSALGGVSTYTSPATTDAVLATDLAMAGATLVVNGTLDTAGHDITGTGAITVNDTLRNVAASDPSTIAPAVTINGTTGTAYVDNGARLDLASSTNLSGTTLTGGTWIAGNGSAVRFGALGGALQTVTGNAVIELHGSTGVLQSSGGADALLPNGAGSTLTIAPAGRMVLDGDGAVSPRSSDRVLAVQGALDVLDSAMPSVDSIVVSGTATVDAELDTTGDVDVSGILQGAGDLDADDVSILPGGTARGTLTVDASSVTVSGSLLPGDGNSPAIGAFTIDSDAVFDSTSSTVVHIAGASSFDSVDVTGELDIDTGAAINVQSTGFSAPAFGSSFGIITTNTFADANQFTATLGTLTAPRIYVLEYTSTAVNATVPDTNPPTGPSTVTASHGDGSSSSDPTVELTISGASDAESGMAGFAIVADHSPSTLPAATVNVPSTSGSATWTSSALADGTWYVHVRAVDVIGNGAVAAVTRGPFTIDATAPVAPTITGLPSGTSYPGTFTATIGPIEGGGSLQCTLDGAALAGCSGTTTLANVPVGTHTLRAWVVDAVGNASAVASAQWKVIPVPQPPLAPAIKDVKVLGGTGTFTALARVPALRLSVPVRQNKVKVRVWLVLSKVQAQRLGITLDEGKRWLVLGTGIRVSSRAGKLPVNVRLTLRAREIMRRYAQPGSSVHVLPVQARMSLTRDRRRSTVFVPLRLRPER